MDELIKSIAECHRAHADWAEKIEKFINDKKARAIKVEKDEARCDFEKRLECCESHLPAPEYGGRFREIISALKENHRTLHKAVAEVERAGNSGYGAAEAVYRKKVKPALRRIEGYLDQMAAEAGRMARRGSAAEDSVEWLCEHVAKLRKTLGDARNVLLLERLEGSLRKYKDAFGAAGGREAEENAARAEKETQARIVVNQ